MLEVQMPPPSEAAIRRQLVFDPSFHDVDALLERIAPGILDWRQLNQVGGSIQRSVKTSETLERYVLDLWEATHKPQSVGVRLGGVDMEKLVLAGASPRGMMALARAARVVAWLAGRTYLTPDDIRTMAHPALEHRIFFTPVYELRRAQL